MKTRLFNPGPTNVSEDVRSALGARDICHREPEFVEVLLRIKKTILKILSDFTNNPCNGTKCFYIMFSQ